MKNKDILKLKQSLDLVGNLNGIKFAYAIARNKKFIESEIEAFNEIIKPSEKFKEFDAKRVALCQELGDKNEKGEVKFANNQYVIVENKTKFDKEFGKLKTEYKKDIEERDKKIKEFNEVFLEANSKFEFYRIKLEDIPKEITAAQMGAIIDLIEG